MFFDEHGDNEDLKGVQAVGESGRGEVALGVAEQLVEGELIDMAESLVEGFELDLLVFYFLSERGYCGCHLDLQFFKVVVTGSHKVGREDIPPQGDWQGI